MIEVTLYTKVGCHLCEEAKEMLMGLTAVYPHQLTEIDITQDPAIFSRYHYIIPVVHVGFVELQAPITHDQLKMALESSG
ncbi:MAG: glutaredoxin family protein [Chloroflexi bacterium]|nr:glutaredoxin family protein [Chloroflexota bacterium]